MKSLPPGKTSRMPAHWQRAVDLCCDARQHCALVLVANVGLVACGMYEPLSPAVVLHAVLLPVNGWRLLRALRAGPPSAVRAAAAARDEVAPLQQRAAAMRWQRDMPTSLMQTVRLPPRVAG